jgi:hypothetical protein
MRTIKEETDTSDREELYLGPGEHPGGAVGALILDLLERSAMATGVDRHDG